MRDPVVHQVAQPGHGVERENLVPSQWIDVLVEKHRVGVQAVLEPLESPDRRLRPCDADCPAVGLGLLFAADLGRPRRVEERIAPEDGGHRLFEACALVVPVEGFEHAEHGFPAPIGDG